MPNVPILLWMGTSRDKWGALALPLDLTPLGAPGNRVWVALDVGSAVLPNPGGGGALTVPVPNESALKGITFFLQSMLVDPFANTIQLDLSNGLEVVIGT